MMKIAISQIQAFQILGHFNRAREKNTDDFLEDWAMRTKLPVPKKIPKNSNSLRDEEQCFCNICKQKLSSSIVAMRHYRGKQHLSRERQLKESEKREMGSTIGRSFSNPVQVSKNFFCPPCAVTMTSKHDLAAHQRGRKHRVMTKQYEC